MNTVREMLRDADPVRTEDGARDPDRDRLREAIVAAACRATLSGSPRLSGSPSGSLSRRRVVVVAIAAAIVAGVAGIGPLIWSRGGATLQAAVRFEVRLAEVQPGADLLEAGFTGSGTAIYLHREIVATNGDVARSRVVRSDDGSRFSIAVEFTPEGAEKMRHATADHLGRPVAILIDGSVVMAPVLRSPIDGSAVISGDFNEAEAQRIVNGIIRN